MTNRKALIVGATGLIGGYCLQALLNNPNYSEVIALVRKPIVKTHRKLKTVVTKFDNLEHELSNIQADDVFCCLGTTIKKAGSQEAFKRIDLSLVATVAELMKKQGAEQYLVISALGADKDSKVFYNRVKGEMESVLEDLGYPCLRIIRPSLLLGEREEFRLGEKIGVLLTPVLKPFLLGSLKKYRPVEAESVARFMVKIGEKERTSGVHIYESNMID
ncbi:MAG: oxidoreductase [Desulfobulbaceae bacterium]|nr:oxidoreductase [Desulfobulbaceae bacterium]